VAAPAHVDVLPPPPVAAAPQRASLPSGPWVRLAPALVLGLTLLGLLARDLTVRPPDATEAEEEETVALEIDKDPRVALVKLPEVVQFGLTTKDNKKLTFMTKIKDNGHEILKLTSYPAIRIDNKAYKPGMWDMIHGVFRKEGDVRRTDNVAIRYPGSLVGQPADLPADANGEHAGQRVAWLWDRHQVVLTQAVEIVAGQADAATGKIPLDTCLVRFTLTNKDSRPHKVGFRFLLDTFIGDNDGVPFYVPRQDKPLINDMEDFKSENMPDYIQALETGKLDKPGTVARVSLKVGGGVEPPGHVALTHHVRTLPFYSEADKEVQVTYDIPLASIQGNPKDKDEDQRKPDSAVALYWQDKDLAPGEERTVGFAYGLGQLASGESGKLAVTPPSNPRAGEDFPVVALVSDPVAGQTVELRLQKGLHLVAGAARQAVPPVPEGAPSANSSVTWVVKADRAGTYKVRVRTISGGKPQEVPAVVTVRGNIFQ
jgi:hypothetical protein